MPVLLGGSELESVSGGGWGPNKINISMHVRRIGVPACACRLTKTCLWIKRLAICKATGTIQTYSAKKDLRFFHILFIIKKHNKKYHPKKPKQLLQVTVVIAVSQYGPKLDKKSVIWWNVVLQNIFFLWCSIHNPNSKSYGFSEFWLQPANKLICDRIYKIRIMLLLIAEYWASGTSNSIAFCLLTVR